MAEKLLSGFRALDLTNEIGFVCGKILAAMGVDVIKIEKPGGDLARYLPPFIDETPHPERSLYWMANNTDKRGITLNLNSNQGKELFCHLVKDADFILESFEPGYLDHLGLSCERLKKINPGIILTSISVFGQKGPYARFKGSELIASAMSGVLATNGDPDRAPVREGLDAITFEANAAAALGTVTAHMYRQISGQGQQVDVSIQEVAAKRTFTNIVVWEFDKRLIKRNGPMRTFGARTTRWIWRCSDGYVFWTYMGGKFGAPANRALSKWIDEDGLDNPLQEITDWNEFDMAAISQETLDLHQKTIAQFFGGHTKEEIALEGLKRGINACAIHNPEEVLNSPQLKSRKYWTGLMDSDPDKTLYFPRHFFLSNQTENAVTKRAPHIGEDNRDIYSGELGLSSDELKVLNRAGVI